MGQTTTVRERQITRTSIIGILTNVVLEAFKAAVGLVAHSIAIVLDAVNNLSDALSSVITIVGIRLAKRKPDKDHPFGHGRIEYFSAIIIAGIVFAAGVTSLVESVKKLFQPGVPDYSTVTLIVISVAILTKLVLGRYVKKKGEELRSDALVASGSDALFDALISASTLLGALVTLRWHISLDGIIGILIAVFIIKAGVEMLGRPLSEVLGRRAGSELTQSIKADVASIPGVLGAYDLILHNYGPESAIGSVHVEVPDALSAKEVNSITKQVQRIVLERHSLFLTVGIYAVNDPNGSLGPMAQDIRETVKAFDGIKSVHGLVIDDVRHYISFDGVIEFKVDDKNELKQAIAAALKEKYPDYTAEISFDIDYSD